MQIENTISLSSSLPWDIRGLGIIFEDGLSAKRARDILSIISQDLVSFVKSEPFPCTLRAQWESDIKKQFTLFKKAQKKLITQIQKKYQVILERITDANLSDIPLIAAQLKAIEETLYFRKGYGHPPFYIMALGFLNGLCSELLKMHRREILDGLVKIDCSNSKKPYLLESLCAEELFVFAELNRNFNFDNIDVSWLPWLIFQKIKECWTLPPKKFEKVKLSYSSQKESLKSSHFLNFHNFWYDLRMEKLSERPAKILTAERMTSQLRSMIRQLHVHAASYTKTPITKDYIRSISLELDGGILCLVIKKEKESIIYLLKRLQDGKSPYKLISWLLKNPGEEFHLESISSSQAMSNLLARLALKGTLANIFISHTNRTAILLSREIQFSQLPERQKLNLQELLPKLKPYIVK